MKLEPGMLIAPNVKLSRILAFGGGGSVWVADHQTLHTEVAVKFIAEDGPDDETVARFQREAALAAQIKSPHVVQMFDHGMTADRIPYIVMELLEGEDLGSRLKRSKRLGLEETALVIGHVCKALAAAHAKGFVHRDIKPQNIFLTDSSGDVFVKVLDFGVAKKSGDETFVRTTTGSVIGTPHYMSPEQVRSSRSVDSRCDLWATTVVAYQCLTGQRPFHGESIGALSVVLDYGVFAPASTIVAELPAVIDDFFARGLNHEIERRFGSARELSEAFSQAVREARQAGVVARVPAVAPSALPASTGSNLPTRFEPLPPKRPKPPAALGYTATSEAPAKPAVTGSGTLVMKSDPAASELNSSLSEPTARLARSVSYRDESPSLSGAQSGVTPAVLASSAAERNANLGLLVIGGLIGLLVLFVGGGGLAAYKLGWIGRSAPMPPASAALPALPPPRTIEPTPPEPVAEPVPTETNTSAATSSPSEPSPAPRPTSAPAAKKKGESKSGALPKAPPSASQIYGF